MTKFQTIANRSRLELIRKSCDEDTIDKLDSFLETTLSEIDTPFFKIIELFSLIDNVGSIDFNKLPIYTSGSRKIHILNNQAESDKAVAKIHIHRIVGFDTEQKPTFTKGAIPNGISLMQIATKHECFIFQIKQIRNIKSILNILEDSTIVKVGSGLRGDKSTLAKEFRVSLRKTIDLGNLFKSGLGHEHDIGIKKSVASILGQKISKSRSMSTSNWEKKILSDSQIKYAAEDAFAAYDVFCTLIKNYSFTINSMPPWFQESFGKGVYNDDLG